MEMLRRNAGMTIQTQLVDEGHAALSRAERFVDSQADRPIADQFLLTELAKKNDVNDGHYLTQILDQLADELATINVNGFTRELSLCLTKVQEAYDWAVRDGVKKGTHVIIDRRFFQVNDTTQEVH
jgi:hypothetical protein